MLAQLLLWPACPLLGALGLDLQDLVQRLDQALVRVLAASPDRPRCRARTPCAVSTLAVLSMSAFFCSRVFVISVTLPLGFHGASASRSMPSVRTIWFFHSGMVLMMEVWIFSDHERVVVLDHADLRRGLQRR